MYRLIILLALLGLAPVLAQDTASEDEVAAGDEVAAESPDAESPEDNPYYDDFELDLGNDDHTEEDEDVFEASVKVSYQQSVPFPTDI